MVYEGGSRVCGPEGLAGVGYHAAAGGEEETNHGEILNRIAYLYICYKLYFLDVVAFPYVYLQKVSITYLHLPFHFLVPAFFLSCSFLLKISFHYHSILCF